MSSTNWMRLVRSGESLNVEFKRQAPKLERLSKTFSAFANSSGGYVFFGVTDRGDVCGLDHPEGTRDLIQQVAQFHCDPIVQAEIIDWAPLKGSHVLIVRIPEAGDKPVYAVNPQNRKMHGLSFAPTKKTYPWIT